MFFFIPYHTAHILHTNLIPCGRCPVHILGKGKKNLLLETETGSHSGSGNHTTPEGVRFDFQAVSFEDFCHEYKRLICKQSADYLLFYFQLFCCRVVTLPLPSAFLRWLFPKGIFFSGLEEKKCWLLCFAMENAWVTSHFWPPESKFFICIFLFFVKRHFIFDHLQNSIEVLESKYDLIFNLNCLNFKFNN